MCFIPLLLLPAMVATAWSLWVRRVTWNCPWDRTATIVGLLMLTGIILTAPAFQPKFLGYYNIDDLVGDIMLIWAAGGIAWIAESRIRADTPARIRLRRGIELPITLAATAMMICFALGNAQKQPGALDRIPMAPWLQAYWAVVCGTIIWLLSYAIRALLTLRAVPRHRTMAHLYIGTSMCGIAASIIAGSETLLNNEWDHGHTLQLIFTTLWMGGFALSATYSWRRKTRPIRLLRSLGARSEPQISPPQPT